MNSNRNKPGGGSGGDPGDPVYIAHDDIAMINGKFKRTADNIYLMTVHDEGVEKTHIAVLASGDQGQVHLQGGMGVNVITGLLGDQRPPELDKAGITVFGNDLAQVIRLQLAYFENPDGKSITISSTGIVVDAGVSGTLTLQAGPGGASSIVIAADGITLKAVKININ